MVKSADRRVPTRRGSSVPTRKGGKSHGVPLERGNMTLEPRTMSAQSRRGGWPYPRMLRRCRSVTGLPLISKRPRRSPLRRGALPRVPAAARPQSAPWAARGRGTLAWPDDLVPAPSAPSQKRRAGLGPVEERRGAVEERGERLAPKPWEAAETAEQGSEEREEHEAEGHAEEHLPVRPAGGLAWSSPVVATDRPDEGVDILAGRFELAPDRRLICIRGRSTCGHKVTLANE
jgi:hypothetical protein